MTFIQAQKEEFLNKLLEHGLPDYVDDSIMDALSQVVQNTVATISKKIQRKQVKHPTCDTHISYNVALADVQSLLKDISKDV